RFSIDRAGFVVNDKSFVLPNADWGVLGVLNSKLAFFYFAIVCAALEGEEERYLEFRAQYVRNFPLPSIPKHSKQLQAIGSLAEALTVNYEGLAHAETEQDEEFLRRRSDELESRLDRAVCALYGLTEAEEKIVLECDMLA